MKHVSKTFKEKQRGMTAIQICRPVLVLFFANPHFSFINSQPTLHTLLCLTSRHSAQSLPNSAINIVILITKKL